MSKSYSKYESPVYVLIAVSGFVGDTDLKNFVEKEILKKKALPYKDDPNDLEVKVSEDPRIRTLILAVTTHDLDKTNNVIKQNAKVTKVEVERELKSESKEDEKNVSEGGRRPS